ncbi:MAG: hypothetical protein ACJ8HQ_00860 [Chthoniobacterales bacterium]
MKKISRILLISSILALAWGGSIAFAVRILAAYDANRVPTVPSQFPSASALRLATTQPTVVMLANAEAQSTRDSVTELAQMNRELNATVYVVFAPLAQRDMNWGRSASWNTAAEISGVVPVGDDDGIETRRFGAQPSGYTMIFASDGRLLFSGDITKAHLFAHNELLERHIAAN